MSGRVISPLHTHLGLITAVFCVHLEPGFSQVAVKIGLATGASQGMFRNVCSSLVNQGR